MNAAIINAARSLFGLAGGIGSSTKHDHYVDFGWPKDIKFAQYKRMYERNSLAAAAVDKTAAKTWETLPELWQSEKAMDTPLEKAIKKHFAEAGIWRSMMDVDRRSMVGRYAAFIVLVADGKELDQPLESAPADITSLVGIIPCWENQIRVTKVDTDTKSRNYGKPQSYEFIEPPLDGQLSGRTVKVHASRVIIWSEDGTTGGRSMLEPGFNDLIDSEKIKGAGGEGFWKNSRGAPIIEAPEGMTAAQVAKAMSVDTNQLIDKVNEQIESFNQGFDKGLMLGGMTAKPMVISLPNPQGFFDPSVACFSSSIQMPVRILLGNQTGERASTEDAREWAKVNMARRNNLAIPVIRSFINLMVKAGILPTIDWVVGWSDLTEATASEKMDRSSKMSEINAKVPMGELPVFTPDEIREAAGYKPLIEVDPDFISDFEDGDDLPAVDPPPDDEKDDQDE